MFSSFTYVCDPSVLPAPLIFVPVISLVSLLKIVRRESIKIN